jgi:hypothetical protein
MASTDLGFSLGGDTMQTELTGRLSIWNMYIVLSSYLRAYEKNLADNIKVIEGNSAADIDQGTLLQLQAMVQVWATVASTATGIVRTIGDTLAKIVQNIRSS